MWVRHLSPLYLSGLGLARLDHILKHVHALVACVDKVLGLHKPTLTRSDHERHVSEVSRATQVGDEFLCRHSHELEVEVGSRARWVSSAEGALAVPDSCLGSWIRSHGI